MREWIEYGVWFLLLILASALFFKIGARRARRDVVHTFNEILVRIYQLVWSGRDDELHKFLSEVMGEELPERPDPKIIRHNKKGKGYNQ